MQFNATALQQNDIFRPLNIELTSKPILFICIIKESISFSAFLKPTIAFLFQTTEIKTHWKVNVNVVLY